jgi:hypothetical protein
MGSLGIQGMWGSPSEGLGPSRGCAASAFQMIPAQGAGPGEAGPIAQGPGEHLGNTVW